MFLNSINLHDECTKSVQNTIISNTFWDVSLSFRRRFCSQWWRREIKRFGRASITYSYICVLFLICVSIFFRNFLAYPLARISSLHSFRFSSWPRISQHRRLPRYWVSFPPRLLGSAESHPGQSFPQWRLSKMDVPHVGRCSRLLVFQDLFLAGYLVPQRPLRCTRWSSHLMTISAGTISTHCLRDHFLNLFQATLQVILQK